MPPDPLIIPPAWDQINLAALRGLVFIIGAPDSGKTTLARHLYRRLGQAGLRGAYIDGDPGQSTLGPPTTITVAVSSSGETRLSPPGDRRHCFVGAVSPRGHMLPLLVGASRLLGYANSLSPQVIVYDTCGLIDPAQGGLALKFAKINLLRPATIFALQKGDELAPLLGSLGRSQRTEIVTLPVSTGARRKEIARRQAHRRAQFQAYFAPARQTTVNWKRWATYPGPEFIPHRLAALEDVSGFVIGLAVITAVSSSERNLELLTPVEDLRSVDTLHLGDLKLDPHTFYETRL